VNALAPPKKKRAPTKSALKTAELLQVYQVAPSVQAQWQQEGEGLLALYRKNRRARHWRAYCVHLAGMAARLERSGQ
jgi:hypothetical protein